MGTSIYRVDREPTPGGDSGGNSSRKRSSAGAMKELGVEIDPARRSPQAKGPAWERMNGDAAGPAGERRCGGKGSRTWRPANRFFGGAVPARSSTRGSRCRRAKEGDHASVRFPEGTDLARILSQQHTPGGAERNWTVRRQKCVSATRPGERRAAGRQRCRLCEQLDGQVRRLFAGRAGVGRGVRSARSRGACERRPARSGPERVSSQGQRPGGGFIPGEAAIRFVAEGSAAGLGKRGSLATSGVGGRRRPSAPVAALRPARRPPPRKKKPR